MVKERERDSSSTVPFLARARRSLSIIRFTSYHASLRWFSWKIIIALPTKMIFTLPWLLFRHEWRSRTDHYLGNNWSRSHESGNFHRLRKTIFLVLFSLSLFFFFFYYIELSRTFIYLLDKVHRDFFIFKTSFNLLCHNVLFLDTYVVPIVNDFYSIENFIEDETEISRNYSLFNLYDVLRIILSLLKK